MHRLEKENCCYEFENALNSLSGLGDCFGPWVARSGLFGNGRDTWILGGHTTCLSRTQGRAKPNVSKRTFPDVEMQKHASTSLNYIMIITQGHFKWDVQMKLDSICS